MARCAEDLAAEAVALPTDERVVLFETLARTLLPPAEDPVAAVWLDEAERRWEEMERGEEPGIPGEQVFAELRAHYRR